MALGLGGLGLSVEGGRRSHGGGDVRVQCGSWGLQEGRRQGLSRIAGDAAQGQHRPGALLKILPCSALRTPYQGALGVRNPGWGQKDEQAPSPL